jgi:purine-cytosine permease-like protein
VTDGTLTPNAGIIVIALLSLFISFCGFRVLHLYERYAWIPAIISIVIATGCGGRELKEQSTRQPPAAPMVLNFGMIVASYMIPWAAIASDITTYFNPKVPS